MRGLASAILDDENWRIVLAQSSFVSLELDLPQETLRIPLKARVLVKLAKLANSLDVDANTIVI